VYNAIHRQDVDKPHEDGRQIEIGSQGNFLYKTCQVFWNKEYKRLPTVNKANEKDGLRHPKEDFCHHLEIEC